MLLFDNNQNVENPTVYFNISIHAPFEELNRIFFSLFVCGSLIDTISGSAFSLPNDGEWTFVFEIPFMETYGLTIAENFHQLLPVLCIVNSKVYEEVTQDNYPLHIGEEEELVARFWGANESGKVDRMCIEKRDGTEIPVEFKRLEDEDKCRLYIYRCIKSTAEHALRNRISERSFIKFMYRRVRFFLYQYYRYNDRYRNLGSILMKQMLREACDLSKMSFARENYPRVFLIYDPSFSLYLLHDNWNSVSLDLRTIFDNDDPSRRIEFKGTNYYGKCLAWLLDIPYEAFVETMQEMNFILIENFTYKLFHVHERKLTKMPLIIEGETGVGKTFLLEFYSRLMNVKILKGSLDNYITPRIADRFSVWLRRSVIEDVLEKDCHVISTVLQKITNRMTDREISKESITLIPELNQLVQVGVDDNEEENASHLEETHLSASIESISTASSTTTMGLSWVDSNFLKELKANLSEHKYDKKRLVYLWKIIINTTYKISLNTCNELLKMLVQYIRTQLDKISMIEKTMQLTDLLDSFERDSTPENGLKTLTEYLYRTTTKSLFYRLLIHPGITQSQIQKFMEPICELANEKLESELVVFFDEINTSSCLGLFKEMMIDGSMNGVHLPKNIFFTAAINPSSAHVENPQMIVHRSDYLVNQLPEALENLKIVYNSLEPNALKEYVEKKIKSFPILHQFRHDSTAYIEQSLIDCIIAAQNFSEERLGISITIFYSSD